MDDIAQPKIIVTNKCENGYFQIDIEGIKSIQGESYPDNSLYKNKTYAELIEQKEYVTWKKGVNISSRFLLRIEMNPVRTNESFCYLGDVNNGNYFELKWLRDEINELDKFVLIGYENHNIILRQYSNTISLFNNVSDVLIWIKKIGDSYDLILTNYDETPTTFEWNESSNVEYYKNLSMLNGGSAIYANDKKGFPTDREILNSTDNLFPIKTVKIRNGLFKMFDITENTNVTYNKDTAKNTVWDFDTSIMHCNFNNNINAGSLDMDVQGVVVKHQDIDLKTDTIVGWLDDGSMSIGDPFIMTQHSYTHSLEIITIDGENQFLYKTQYPQTIILNGVFVSDKKHTYKLYNGVVFGSMSQNITTGIYTPLGTKYPVVIKNGDTNYLSGSVTGRFSGYNYENNRNLNSQNITKQINDFRKFLSNGNAKAITDWNGNCYLVRVSSSPTINPIQNGYGMADISFDFVEQGDYDSEWDIYNIGLARGLE